MFYTNEGHTDHNVKESSKKWEKERVGEEGNALSELRMMKLEMLSSAHYY